MSHLNFRFSIINDKIRIIIDEVHLADQESDFPTDLAEYFSGYKTNRDTHRYTIYYILHNLIKNAGKSGQVVTRPIETNTICFWAPTIDGWKLHSQTSSIFELPKTPHLALLWLAYMSTAMTANFQTTFSQYAIEDKLKAVKQDNDIPLFPIMINKFFNEPYGDNDFKQLMVELIKFSQGLSAYQATRDAIHYFNRYYRVGVAPFAGQLRAANLDKVLFKKIGDQTLDLSIPLSDRTNNLLAYAQSLLRNNNTLELNFIINNINWMAKAKIYTKCLGKQAADGGYYNLAYTEWNFFQRC